MDKQLHCAELEPAWRMGRYEWRPSEDRIRWSPELTALLGLPDAPETKQGFMDCVHPQDVQKLTAQIGATLSDGTRSFSRSYRIVRPDGDVLTVLDRGSIERDATGMIDQVRGIIVDVADQAESVQDAERKLHASEARHHALFQAIDEGFCVVEVRFDGPGGQTDYRVTEANPAFFVNTGFPEAVLGAWLREAAPDLEEDWYEIYGSVARSGEPRRFELQSEVLGRWFDVYAFRIDEPEDRRVAILFKDISDRKQQEQKSELLLHELNHRSKNILGLVQVIARQTASQGSGDFLDRFRLRVQALAAAQDLLVRNDNTAVSLSELIETQLPHFSHLIGNRIAFDGPPVTLVADMAQALGMAIHELATNASKYGALSNDTGTVNVSWSAGSGPGAHFKVAWTERGGPPVAEPESTGFGTRVTRDMVEASTGGEVTTAYAADGFSWQLNCPAALAVA